jgi:hypothetical protein
MRREVCGREKNNLRRLNVGYLFCPRQCADLSLLPARSPVRGARSPAIGLFSPRTYDQS